MSKCAHPNPQPHVDQVGNFSIICPECKLSVSERQVNLVLAWSKKLQGMKSAAGEVRGQAKLRGKG